MKLPLKGSETGQELGSIVADGIRRLIALNGSQIAERNGFSRERVLACANEVAESHLAASAR
jgi:hypothetical protein